MTIPANSQGQISGQATSVPPATRPASQTATQAPAASADTFQPLQTSVLLDAIKAGPPVRADRVAYAKQLLADPNYPPANVMKQVAARIVANAYSGPAE